MRRLLPRRPDRPLPRYVAGALVAVLVLVVLAGALGGWRAWAWGQALEAGIVGDLEAGAHELDMGKQRVASATPTNLAPLDDAVKHFQASRRHFRDAAERTEGDAVLQRLAGAPLLGPGYVAPRLRAVAGVAAMGVALAAAGEDTAAIDGDLLAPSRAGLSAGQRLIAFLGSSGPGIEAVRGHLGQARRAAATVDLRLLPASQRQLLQKARTQVDSALAGLDAFAQLAPPILEIMGDSGPRTYLFEQVDPAELRGAGGFIGSYSLLRVDHGLLDLGGANDVAKIDIPYPRAGQSTYISPPGPLRQAFEHGWVFGDSNHSPDFPTAAQDGERLFKSQTGRSVDGVISIDPWAVAALLAVTGPLSIPQYATTVRAETFAEEVFQRLETVQGSTPEKKAFFPAVATLVIQKVNALPSTQWASLLTALNTTVTQRHLQVYFNDPRAQAEMEAIGWSGPSIGPHAGADETLMEVESNLGGTKSNHFLTRTLTLEMTVDGDRLAHVLRVGWRNDTPTGYVGASREYDVYLRTYLTTDASDVRVGGLVADRYPPGETPKSAVVADGWAPVPPGASRQCQVEWSTTVADLWATYVLYWRKQAGTLADHVHLVLHVSGSTFSADTDLSQDRQIVLTPAGLQVRAGAAGSATVPFLHP